MMAGQLESLRVAVVVLGDIARSPRMRYHALALASVGATVDLVGYLEKDPPEDVARHPRIRIHRVPAFRAAEREQPSLPRYVGTGISRSVRLAWSLFRTLAFRCTFDLILLQNPPIIPAGAVAILVARLRGARVIMDCHNFSRSMVALRLGGEHPVVELLGVWERRLAVMMDAHLCVSRAMSETLRRSWGIGAHVLHDRPPLRTEATQGRGRREILERVWGMKDTEGGPLIMTASSWTDDEDLDMFLDAAIEVDQRLLAQGDWRRMIFVASGEGPRRARFERRVAEADLAHVVVLTGWLTQEDYDILLGDADLGVSLHRSASGVDLPMKIADMQGAGLPVAALDYGPVLREVLDPGGDGLLFSDAAGLAGIIERLFCRGTEGRLDLARLGRTARERHVATWMDGWKREALPVIESLMAQ